MKKLNFRGTLAILAMCVVLGFGFMSCATDDDGGAGKTSGDLYENHTSFAIRVSNLSAFDLVAFKGSLAKENLIGGVKAKTSNSGLKNDPAIFPANPASFQILFITREQYEKESLASLTNKVFIRTYVFWNGSSGDNSKVYEISEKLGGDYKIQIMNPSNYDVEFRDKGTSGPTVGYAPSGMGITYLDVDGGDYDIYPIFQRYNKTRDIMETIIPIKAAVGEFPKQPFSYSFGFSSSAPKGDTKILSLAEATGAMSTMETGVVYICFKNSLGPGNGVRLVQGSTPMITPGGNQVINSGEFIEFAILLPKQGQNYMPSTSATFQVFLGTIPVSVKAVENNSTTLTLLADMMYTINATPDNGLTATVELRENKAEEGTFGQEGYVPAIVNGRVPFVPEDNIVIK